jgi:hypothetical protein
LREERSRLRDEKETLAGAVAELKRRLLLAQSERAAADAQQHINRVDKLLVALVECAPQLDACWGTVVPGQAGGFRHVVGPKNSGLYVKAGTLVGEIIGALKALKLDRGVSWPPRRFELMHIDDFRIELEKLVQAFQLGRLVRTRNFVHLIGDWSASVRAALAQHEQTDNAGRVAA